MVIYCLGAAFYVREGVDHAQMRRLDTETPMDESPSVLRPDGLSSIVVKETICMSIVS
jgi:hypothetical protein